MNNNNQSTNVLLCITIVMLGYMIYSSNENHLKTLMFTQGSLMRYDYIMNNDGNNLLGVLDKVKGTITSMSSFDNEQRTVTLTIRDFVNHRLHQEGHFPVDTLILHKKRIKGFSEDESWFGRPSVIPNPNLQTGQKYGGSINE